MADRIQFELVTPERLIKSIEAEMVVPLPLGLVDIKVCAIDETWSGLKLVIRKELRKPPRRSRS